MEPVLSASAVAGLTAAGVVIGAVGVPVAAVVGTSVGLVAKEVGPALLTWAVSDSPVLLMRLKDELGPAFFEGGFAEMVKTVGDQLRASLQQKGLPASRRNMAKLAREVQEKRRAASPHRPSPWEDRVRKSGYNVVVRNPETGDPVNTAVTATVVVAVGAGIYLLFKRAMDPFKDVKLPKIEDFLPRPPVVQPPRLSFKPPQLKLDFPKPPVHNPWRLVNLPNFSELKTPPAWRKPEPRGFSAPNMLQPLGFLPSGAAR